MSEEMPQVTEEKGLTLWRADRDIHVVELRNRRCRCGGPAVAAVRRLDDPGELRVYLCEGHASARVKSIRK